MIFSELYSSYYNAVARMLTSILRGCPDEKALLQIAREEAFAESAASIFSAVQSEQWQIIRKDMTTPIKNEPSMPLTLLEKRWLKAISLDPRVRLFGISFDGIEDVEPLFTQEDYCVYDKYGDGDPFENEHYIGVFRTVLNAIHKKTPLKITIVNKNGARVTSVCIPERLEYSEKDDKFRLETSGSRYMQTVKLSAVLECSVYTGKNAIAPWRKSTPARELVLEITDTRNALERCMMHFAHFEKQAEHIEGARYLLRLKYDMRDETEIVIRVLSFGPMVRAVAPQTFVDLIKERLIMQKKLWE